MFERLDIFMLFPTSSEGYLVISPGLSDRRTFSIGVIDLRMLGASIAATRLYVLLMTLYIVALYQNHARKMATPGRVSLDQKNIYLYIYMMTLAPITSQI